MPNDNGHNDRRANHWIRDLVIPLVIAVVVGISSAVLTVRISVAVITTEMIGLKEDVVDLKLVLSVVQQNQIDKNRIELIATDNREEIIEMWREINVIKETRYTKKDAERDMEILRLEAKARHGEPVQ